MKESEQRGAVTRTGHPAETIEPREPEAHPHYPARPLQTSRARMVLVETADAEDEAEEWAR